MVDQHTSGSDDDRAGQPTSTDAPMGHDLAHARAGEADWLTLTAGRRTVRIAPEALEAACRGGQAEDVIAFGGDHDEPALAWLAGYDPGDGKGGAIGETDGSEEFTRDVVLAAFQAGRAHKAEELAAPLAGAVRLLTEASQLFRTYEGHHQGQAAAMLRKGRAGAEAGYSAEDVEGVAGAVGDRIGKARRNGEMAERIEAFLLTDTTPRDRLTGLALSLVQDLDALMGDSTGVAGLHQNGDVAPWDELRRGGQYEDWLKSFDALVEARLFPLGDIRNDTGGRAAPSYGMDPEIADALRQAHDGTA